MPIGIGWEIWRLPAALLSPNAAAKTRSTARERQWARRPSTARARRTQLRLMDRPLNENCSVHMKVARREISSNWSCGAGIWERLYTQVQTSVSAPLGVTGTSTGTTWISGGINSITRIKAVTLQLVHD